jgi:hypothetical protein
MTSTELQALEQPITDLSADDLPITLAERAAAYNAAVDAFHHAVRQALEEVQAGRVVQARKAEALRAYAADLISARAWLVQMARKPQKTSGS